MDFLVSALIVLILIFSIFNFFTARFVSKENLFVSEPVAILIPMRNEADNAKQVIASALSQVNLGDFKVRVLDDGSSDGTALILNNISDPKLETFKGEEPPKDWLGKNYALQNLADKSDEEFLVFIDADVRLEESAIADSISLMNRLGWDYISPYPRQEHRGVIGFLVQPLLQWSWFASLPLRAIERSSKPSTVVANGQFFILRNSLYRKSGGHQAIKGEVLDDMELARLLRRNGGLGSVVDGSKISSCLMYQSTNELVAGYTKSQWRAFGGLLGGILAMVIMYFSSIFPFLSLMQGELWALFGYLSLVLSRALAAIRTRSSLASAPFHPVAISIWIALIFRSLIFKRLGRLQWRGRTI